jgi:hypothetical protein
VLLVLRGATFVAVVEATEFGKCDDAAIAWRSDRPRDGRVLVERQMSSGAQVVVTTENMVAGSPVCSANS